MLINSDTEILRKQEKIKQSCKREIFNFLDLSAEFYPKLFPKVTIKSSENSLDTLIEIKITKLKQWLSQILDKAIETSSSDDYEETPPCPIILPLSINEKIVRDIVRILSYGRDLLDNSLIFVSDIGESLDIDPHITDSIIEQVLCEKRDKFTHFLLDYLDEDQCYWIALMLYAAINSDQHVHPQEYKYLDNINQLLKLNQTKLKQLGKDVTKFSSISPQQFDLGFHVSIFKYIIEVVMIDGECAPEEELFIQELSKHFDFDSYQQEEIISPISSSLMMRKSLFSY